MSAGNIKGLQVEIGAVTKGLEAALKDIGRASADINKELAQVEKGLKFDPGNTVLLAQKQELLKDKIANTKQGLDALRQAQERVEQMYKAGEIDQGQYRQFQREIATAESKLQTFEKQVKDVDRAQDGAEKSTDKWGDKLKTGLRTGLLAAGAAIAGLVAGIGALGAKVLANADELQKMADKTGLSAERLQELQYVGDDLGVELETIASAQAKLTRSMDAARKGTDDQAKAFAKLGISVTNADGSLRDAKTVMMEAFKALNGVGNETERDALALAIFGRSAQELNPLIVAGGDALADLADEAHRVGAVMSDEAVAALDAFGDTWDHTKMAILGAIGEALAPLMPYLQQTAEWIREHIGPAMQWVVTSIIPLFTGALGESGAGGALSGLIGILGLVRDIFTAAWPIILGAVKMFVDWLNGETGQALIASLLGLVGEAAKLVQSVFEAVWPIVQSVVKSFIDFFDGAGGQKLITTLLGGIGLALDALQKIFEAVWPILQGVVATFIGFFDSDTGQRLIKTLIDAIGTALGALQTLWETVWPLIESALEVAQPVITAALAVIEGAIWLVVQAIDALKEAWEWMQSVANGPSPTEKIAAKAKAEWEAAQAGLPKGQATWGQGHASGGLFDKEHWARIAEGDKPELILPLSDQRRTAELLAQVGLPSGGGFSDAGLLTELRGMRAELRSIRGVSNNQRYLNMSIATNPDALIGQRVATALEPFLWR